MVFRLALLTLTLCALPLTADTREGCVPVVRAKKPAAVVRREITVGIVGEELPRAYRDGKPAVDAVVDHWIKAMDSLSASRPDLVILPEISDFGGLTLARKREWSALRGNRMLDACRDWAKRHRSYVVYPTYRAREDGRFSNCAIWIDREGDVIGVYDKFHPTVRDLGHAEFPVVPGTEPLVVETDFGRVGTAICFDLNFPDILMKYVAAAPDMIVFPSYFDGGALRRAWATLCGSYVVSSTVGSIAKTVIGPAGERIVDEDTVLRTFAVKVNTNFRVLHRDFNKEPLAAAFAKYGSRLSLRNPGPQGLVTLLSEEAGLPVDDVIREFGIETWAAYQARSNAARAAALEK